MLLPPDEGDRVDRRLRRTHRCGAFCPACRQVRRELRPSSLVQRFGALVAGDSGLRFAKARVDFGQAFPPFSDDPFEQWLVEEALLVRYQLIQAIEENDRQAHEQAAAEAQRLLAEYRQAEGVGA